nr:ComF family protein [Desulfobulbaceae bacterium]
MNEKLADFFHSLQALCFPAYCLLCNKTLPPSAKILICPACLPEISFTRQPLCSCCGLEFPNSAPGNHFCSKCLAHKPAFERARAVLRYNDAAARLVHTFKYAGKTYCHSTFAELKNVSTTIDDLDPHDLIIPIPLHIKLSRERVFNQAVILAQLFFPDKKDQIQAETLFRTRLTVPQTGLSGKDRRKNLKNAFDIRQPSCIKGKSVLLIDDVLTTGTTINECAKILKKHGAKNVQALTLARVLV